MSLVCLHWIGIALHFRPFVCNIAILVLKKDVKLQQARHETKKN